MKRLLEPATFGIEIALMMTERLLDPATFRIEIALMMTERLLKSKSPRLLAFALDFDGASARTERFVSATSGMK